MGSFVVAEPIPIRLARLEERVRILEAELAQARQRLHHLGNVANQVNLLMPDPDATTAKRARPRRLEGAHAMTIIRLATYALGLATIVGALLIPHPEAKVYLLPVGTALLGLATNVPGMQPPAPVDKGK